jgi:hypothetical protein
MALALDQVGLEVILVGDSLGEVELGYDSTRAVSVEMMEHHVRAVANGATHTHITGDMPAGSYESPGQAVDTARALVAAGAHSVKLEGAMVAEVRAIIDAGIPVMGHVGLLPQTAEGGYRRHGKTEGTGTGDDQDRDGTNEGFSRFEAKGPAPGEGGKGSRMDHRHIERRCTVGEPDVTRARLGTSVNEARNGRQGRILRACPGTQGQQA